MTGTTYYNLNLPAHGDQNWDTPVNANFTSIDSILHGKQDGLTPGGNIDITSNTISLKKDGTSITNNSSGQIQATGVISTADGSTVLKARPITRADYEALVAGGTVDANTFYGVTDDTDISLTILEALYPVGSVYLTTAAACPLATLGVGTWTLRSTGVITAVSSASTVPVIGNGMATGWTNGTNTGAFWPATSNVNGDTRLYSGYYGRSVGESTNGGTAVSGKSIGITTDADNSGIIADTSNVLNSSSYTVNIFERTA